MTHRTEGTHRRGGAGALVALLYMLAALTFALPGSAAESLRGTVNINTATVEQLSMLPGIGEGRAKAVVEARKRSGGFKRVEDLLEVKGIGEMSLEKLRPFLTLDGKTTAKPQ